MTDSAQTAEQVRNRFRSHAQQFDDLYEDERPLVKLLRPGLFRRRQLVVETVAAMDQPHVLDVGCGSGRIGEFVLETGAGRYVGVDFSEPMIELARARLERYEDRTELIAKDFLKTDLDERFNAILAVGFFDYIPEPERFVARMAELSESGAVVVASFPAWSWLKGPIRKVRYEWLGDCPIFNYTPQRIERLFADGGFPRTEVRAPGRHGYLLRAWRG
jgi:SAM-dependent methyltransferase